jgi:hypothetical protein
MLVEIFMHPSAKVNKSGWQRRKRFGTASSVRQWKQFLFLNLQSSCQENELGIRDATNLGFDFGDCIFADVPTGPCATCGEHSLFPTPAVADFSDNRTDNILRNRFAHVFPLTVRERGLEYLPISEEMVSGLWMGK